MQRGGLHGEGERINKFKKIKNWIDCKYFDA
jgi:hypothetical protein